MSSRALSILLAVWLGVLASVASAFAADSVIVQSRTLTAGATNQQLAIRITNQDTITCLTFPFDIRPLTQGCMPTRLAVSYAERLLTSLTDLKVNNLYTATDGICQNNRAAAYRTPSFTQSDSSFSIEDGPLGILFGAMYITTRDPMPPGSDSVGSIILTLDAPLVPGSFVIDSTCVSPANHLMMTIPIPGQLASEPITPIFVPGVVTIVECNCAYHGDLNGDGFIDATDYNALIDWLFYGVGPPLTDQGCPHIDRGDVNCDGFDDALDLNYLTDYIFFGGAAPCDPCICDPYPTSCP